MKIKKERYRRLAILIPTYNPDDKLKHIVSLLRCEGFQNIIIVNDGSIDDRVLYDIDVDKIIGYGFKRGKGYALKTGFEYITRLDVDGIITLNDRFKYDILDIKKIALKFLDKDGIYFGVRSFDNLYIQKEINGFFSKLFKKIYNYDVLDVQSGVRCFPKNMLSKMIQIKGDGFEYEYKQLKFLALNNYKINNVSINSNLRFDNLFKVMKILFDKNNYV